MFHDLHPVRHAVVAVIADRGDVLLVERAATDTYPGYWSAVTGSLEQGETQQAACVRECREEVGLRVRPVRKVWETITRRAHFVLHWWQCDLDGPRTVTPAPLEVGDYGWVPERDLHRIGLMFNDARWFFREIYPRTRG